MVYASTKLLNSQKITAFIAFILCFIFLASALSFWVSAYPAKSSTSQQLQIVPHQRDLPVSITVIGVTASISIIPGTLNEGEWELSDTSAIYFTSSALPSDDHGNTVIYGHNTTSIFGNLKDAKVGDIIIVTTAQGHSYRYQIGNIRTVRSDQVEILRQTAEKKLTIFTCKGLFDSKRLVITGIPEIN